MKKVFFFKMFYMRKFVSVVVQCFRKEYTHLKVTQNPSGFTLDMVVVDGC